MLLVVVGSGDGVGEYSVMKRFYLSESLWILDIGMFMGVRQALGDFTKKEGTVGSLS